MKLSALILAICLLFSNTLSAQKNKKKKDKTTGDTTIVDINNFTPPRIVKDEEVKPDETYITTAAPVEDVQMVEAPRSDYGYGSGNGNNYNTTPSKTVFDAAGKYYKTSLLSSNYYVPTKYGIEDSTGKTILPTVFSEIEKTQAGIILKLGYLKGLVDNDFKTLIPLEYNYLSAVRGTKWLIGSVNGSYNASRLIDDKGKQVVPGDFYGISELSYWYSNNPKDSAQYLLFSKKDNVKALYSCIKKKFVTDFVIKDVRYTINNDLIITYQSGSRLYTKNMVPIITESFETITTTSKNVLIVTKNKKAGLITNTGKYILPCEYDMINLAGQPEFGCFIAGKKGKFICIDYLGKNLLNDVYDTIATVSYQSSNLIVTKAGKMGVKDILNHTILPIEFDTIYTSGSYSYKYFTRKGKKYAFYSLVGNSLTEFDCDKLERLSNNYQIYYKNNKAGLMSNDFVILSQPIYDKIIPFGYDYGTSEDRFKVSSNNKYGVTSKTLTLIPMLYDEILKLNKAFIVRQNGKYGLIRMSDNKLIAPCQYDYLSNDGSNDSKFIAVEGGTSASFSIYQ